jgi:hypothetical protein
LPDRRNTNRLEGHLHHMTTGPKIAEIAEIEKFPQTFSKKLSMGKFGGKTVFQQFQQQKTLRARKYIDKMPPAVAGQHGHQQTFAVAVALVHGFALSDAEAWPILAEYNTRCAPPWSEAELRHKIESAGKLNRHPKPRGHLLDTAAAQRPSNPPPKSLGRVAAPKGAPILPPAQVDESRTSHEPPPLPLYKPTRTTGTPPPPADYCATCWCRWARALRPGACVCSGHIARPNARPMP